MFQKYMPKQDLARKFKSCKWYLFWGHDDYGAVKNYYDISEMKCHKVRSFRTFYWKNFSQIIPSNIKKDE